MKHGIYLYWTHIYAGTWQYPQGGLHLGVDFATPLFQEVLAPANGIILYADAPVSSNEGYLNNWSGWPQEAGNSICMVCAIQEELYIVFLLICPIKSMWTLVKKSIKVLSLH